MPKMYYFSNRSSKIAKRWGKQQFDWGDLATPLFWKGALDIQSIPK